MRLRLFQAIVTFIQPRRRAGRSFRFATGLVAALGLALTACSKDNFTKYNKLGEMRVLALIVDQPEVSPGSTVHITPVLSDLNGTGRALSFTVQTCIDPGIGIGVTPACKSPDAANSQSGTLTINAGNGQTYTDAVTSFAVTTPDDATMFASRTPWDRYNGVAYLVFYTLNAPDGESVTSFVRVIVSDASKPTKNQNPTITSVNAADQPIGASLTMPTAATNFNVISPAASVETYQTMSPSGSLQSQTEELVNTWFISDGEFDFQRTLGPSENSWSPPTLKPASRGLVMMIITRDSHNGAAYKKIELN